VEAVVPTGLNDLRDAYGLSLLVEGGGLAVYKGRRLLGSVSYFRSIRWWHVSTYPAPGFRTYFRTRREAVEWLIDYLKVRRVRTARSS
jgi:hypothetical protein